MREETCCRHLGYSFRLAARVLLYAPYHRQAFVIPVVEHWLEREIAQLVDETTHRTINERSYHRATSRFPLEEHANYTALPGNHFLLALIPRITNCHKEKLRPKEPLDLDFAVIIFLLVSLCPDIMIYSFVFISRNYLKEI